MNTHVEYRVGTPASYWIVVTGLAAVGAAGAVLFAISLTCGTGVGQVLLLGLTALMAIAPLAYWSGSDGYRVAGDGTIRIFPDRIELPDARATAPLVFPRDGLTITWKQVLQQHRVAGNGALAPERGLGLLTRHEDGAAVVSRGVLLEFRSGLQVRRLSTVTLRDRTQEAALLMDLQLFVNGSPPVAELMHTAGTLFANAPAPEPAPMAPLPTDERAARLLRAHQRTLANHRETFRRLAE